MIEVYFDKGNEPERAYVIKYTAFLVAQYLSWAEIIRRDIQYIDLGEDKLTRRLARLQDDIKSLWQTDQFDPHFRIFAREQRALGEWMVRETSRGPECVGYAAFLDLLQQQSNPLIEALREDVRLLSSYLMEARPRLVQLQNALIDLLEFLDPDSVRFPRERLTKIAR